VGDTVSVGDSGAGHAGVACDDWGGSLTYLLRKYKDGSGCSKRII